MHVWVWENQGDIIADHRGSDAHSGAKASPGSTERKNLLRGKSAPKQGLVSVWVHLVV